MIVIGYNKNMTSNELDKWASKNWKKIAEKIIADSGTTPDERHSCIFMAGIPGSGKTELSKDYIILGKYNAVRLDMDEIATMIDGYEAKNADIFRKAATSIMNNTFGLILKRRLNFIMDGTFGSKHALSNVVAALRRGYMITIICVIQDPKVAWRFTRKREKVEHRAISEEGFIKSYHRVWDNIRMVLKLIDRNNEAILCEKDANLFRNNVSIVVVRKDDINSSVETKRDISLEEFDKIKEINYNYRYLGKYINGKED